MSTSYKLTKDPIWFLLRKVTIPASVGSLFQTFYNLVDTWFAGKISAEAIRLINEGGLIIIDNVLWHGEVADEKKNDKFTLNIREFNEFVLNDKRVEQVIIPLGDGMTVCRVL